MMHQHLVFLLSSTITIVSLSRNSTSGIGFDTLLAEGKTDENGNFELQGHTVDLTSLDPKLDIFHNCDNGILVGKSGGNTIQRCSRKLVIDIPHSYVSRGSSPSTLFNAGVIQLAGKEKGETHDCIH